MSPNVFLTWNKEGLKKLEFQLALQRSSSQILLALGKSWLTFELIQLADNLSRPLPVLIGKSERKLTCMTEKSSCPRQLDGTFKLHWGHFNKFLVLQVDRTTCEIISKTKVGTVGRVLIDSYVLIDTWWRVCKD